MEMGMKPVVIVIVGEEMAAREMAGRVSRADLGGDVVVLVDGDRTLDEPPVREETAILKRLEASMARYKRPMPDEPAMLLREAGKPKQTKAQWRDSLRTHR